jgi:hypothetical protein
MPGAGPLTLDEDLGWYYSAPVAAGALRGAVGQIVVTDDSLVDDDRDAVHDAVASFLTADDHALREASPHAFAYYRDTVRLVREQGWSLQIPEIARQESVWDYVSFGAEFHVDRGFDGDRQVYVSIECECAWEPEHGLQLVFRAGSKVTKVGPFDGHLTNESAFGREDLEGAVYVSPFTL